jgi:hypothetical protein
MPRIFIGDVEPMNIQTYIHRFHVIDEYIIIFLKKYNVLYTSALRFSDFWLVNRGIYPKFISFLSVLNSTRNKFCYCEIFRFITIY